MNLKDIRTRIERILSHAPDVEAWREGLLDRINDALEYVHGLKRWTFRQKLETIFVQADVTILNADWLVDGGNTRGLVIPIPTGWTTEQIDKLEGQIIGIPFEEPFFFVIERVTPSSANIIVIPDPRYSGLPAGKGGITDDLTIRFERYRLPLDLGRVQGIMSRVDERGPLLAMNNYREQRFQLNDTELGPPTHYLLSPNLPTDFRLSATNYPHTDIEPPHNTLLAVPAAAGALTLLGVFEYRIAWAYAGLTSEVGPTTRVTLTGANQTVDLTRLDTWSDAEYGRTRHLFRREIVDKVAQPWFRIFELTDPSVSIHSDAGTFNRFADALVTTRERTFLSGGYTQYIRFWPRPSADVELELLYLVNPRRLDHDSDVPDLPGANHRIIVHRVILEIAPEADGSKLSVLHARLYREQLQLLGQQYGEMDAERHIRRSILGEGPPELLVTPVTFNG